MSAIILTDQYGDLNTSSGVEQWRIKSSLAGPNSNKNRSKRFHILRCFHLANRHSCSSRHYQNRLSYAWLNHRWSYSWHHQFSDSLYLAEIARKKQRGSLAIIQQLATGMWHLRFVDVQSCRGNAVDSMSVHVDLSTVPAWTTAMACKGRSCRGSH